MFRTELPLTPDPHQLPLSARVLTIGSCFSDAVGKRLAATKVHTLANPFGTVFNPISACKLLRAAAGEDTDWQQHLVEARGRWQSYDLHATVGANSPVELLQTLQQLLRDTGVFLATADVVVLTLGTAWAYRLKETNELVSNCHKVPADKFDKELLTPDEVINAVAETHAYLRLRNPKLRFVLTVSPVRHLKDTLPLNAVSKSVLRVACHYLSELLPDVSYFPAYELLQDDLRDYRFYAADMLHPSPVAEDYIWERFARTYFDVEFGRFRKEWEAVQQALHHRPLHPAAPEHRQFLSSTLERLEKLAGQADMRMEILEIRKQLANLPVSQLPLVSEPEADDEERIDVGSESAPTRTAPQERNSPSIAPDSDLEEAENSEAEDLAETMEEGALPKKKRRSRGGAKRNKKKHAARLAEEGAASGTETVLTDAVLAENDHSAQVLPEVPVTTLLLDPSAPLQTALERRKRNSRRGRGRKQTDEASADAVDLHGEAGTVPDGTTTPMAASEVQTSPALPPSEPVALPTEQPAPVVSEESTEAQSQQRPVRTGRSASEVRAAALRKPRRPDSRIKNLYATPLETPAASVEAPQDTVAEAPEAVAVSEISTTAVAANTPVLASAAFGSASSVAQPPRPPVVSAIPTVKGTGASGRLTASGQATLNTSSARPAPALPRSETEPAPTAEVTEKAPAAPVSLTEPISVPPSSPEPAVPAITPDAPADTHVAAPKPRRPASKKAAPVEKPVAAQPAAKAKSTAKTARKVKPAAEAPAAETPASKTPAARRKPTVKPATPDPAPATPPARSPRAPRRKPKAPDGTPEAS